MFEIIFVNQKKLAQQAPEVCA